MFEGRSRRGSLQRGRCPGATSALETLSLSLSLLSFSFWTRSRSASITPRDFRRRGGGGRLFRRSRSDDLRNTPETTRLASRRSRSLACSLVHGFRDGRNESAGSRTTFLRLRRGARQLFAPEGEKEKLADAARSDAQVRSSIDLLRISRHYIYKCHNCFVFL